MRRVAILLASIGLLSRESAAQAGSSSTLARADSAFDAGDAELARRLYTGILAQDSSASRAVFRLAQLQDSPAEALRLYRRYVVLEPGDAWGHMAEGDLLARLGQHRDALEAYVRAEAIAPGERDVALGRARVFERAGRSSEAIDVLAAWTALHPDDGEAWDLLGRVRLRAGRPQGAALAFARASRLNASGSSHRVHLARAAAAPAVTPDARGSVDSDGSRTSTIGGSIDVMPFDGVRIGAAAHRLHVHSEFAAVDGSDATARVDVMMPAGMRLRAELGGVRYAFGGSGNDWTTARAVAHLRTRLATGTTIDVRVEREPSGYNPELIANHVLRSEGRATIELPVGLVRARGGVRLARIEAATEPPNLRSSYEGGLLMPLGDLRPSLLYRVTEFERATAAGYFAPRRVETVDAGGYWESSGEEIVSLAVDVGGGLQRALAHRTPGPPAAPPGATHNERPAWSAVWRAWAQAAVSLAPSRAWFIEIEAYDAAFALEGAGTGDSWRFLSIATGVRWALR